MKRLLLLASLALLTVIPVAGQRLVVGDRAPDLKPGEWLTSAPDMGGKPVVVEFFHSTNKYSVERLGELNRLAGDLKGSAVVVIVTRERNPSVTSLLTKDNPSYYILLDDSSQVFSSYKVRFVPYSVISDRKGRIVWLGNPTALSNDEIIQLMR